MEFTKAVLIQLVKGLCDDDDDPPIDDSHNIRLVHNDAVITDVPKEVRRERLFVLRPYVIYSLQQLEDTISIQMLRHLEQLRERRSKLGRVVPSCPPKHFANSSFKTPEIKISLCQDVYAVFPDEGKHQYYWGWVLRVRKDDNGTESYDVRFEDTFVRVNIPKTEIYHKDQVVGILSGKKSASISFQIFRISQSNDHSQGTGHKMKNGRNGRVYFM